MNDETSHAPDETEAGEFADISVENEIRSAEALREATPEGFLESFDADRIESDGTEGTETAESYMDRFGRFVEGLNLRHFRPQEFLVLGNSNAPGGRCAGLNTFPPASAWARLGPTANMIDEVRQRLGGTVIILSGYRSDGYNRCIGGASRSQHKEFCALDMAPRSASVADLWRVAREVRGANPRFAGGIGRYSSFVHIDTRGGNVDWNG